MARTSPKKDLPAPRFRRKLGANRSNWRKNCSTHQKFSESDSPFDVILSETIWFKKFQVFLQLYIKTYEKNAVFTRNAMISKMFETTNSKFDATILKPKFKLWKIFKLMIFPSSRAELSRSVMHGPCRARPVLHGNRLYGQKERSVRQQEKWEISSTLEQIAISFSLLLICWLNC